MISFIRIIAPLVYCSICLPIVQFFSGCPKHCSTPTYLPEVCWQQSGRRDAAISDLRQSVVPMAKMGMFFFFAPHFCNELHTQNTKSKWNRCWLVSCKSASHWFFVFCFYFFGRCPRNQRNLPRPQLLLPSRGPWQIQASRRVHELNNGWATSVSFLLPTIDHIASSGRLIRRTPIPLTRTLLWV